MELESHAMTPPVKTFATKQVFPESKLGSTPHRRGLSFNIVEDENNSNSDVFKKMASLNISNSNISTSASKNNKNEAKITGNSNNNKNVTLPAPITPRSPNGRNRSLTVLKKFDGKPAYFDRASTFDIMYNILRMGSKVND